MRDPHTLVCGARCLDPDAFVFRQIYDFPALYSTSRSNGDRHYSPDEVPRKSRENGRQHLHLPNSRIG